MHFGNLGTTISTTIDAKRKLDVSERFDLVQFSVPARSHKRPVTENIVAYSEDLTRTSVLGHILSNNILIRVAP